MQSSRTLPTKRRSRIILDRNFPIFSELETGNEGQMLIEASIEEERLEEQPDGTEILIKIARLLKAELIKEQSLRQ